MLEVLELEDDEPECKDEPLELELLDVDELEDCEILEAPCDVEVVVEVDLPDFVSELLTQPRTNKNNK